MTQATEVGRRTRITRPYPSYTLQEALSVARAIYDSNAGLPFNRELLAQALGTTPKSSAFTMRLNASAAYGLTEGGYNDANISITELGEAVVAPEEHEEYQQAIVKAATFPDTFGRFYELLNGRRLPQSANLHSILQRDLDVRADLTEECLEILRDNGEFTGIISEVEGEHFVNLPEADTAPQTGRSPGMISAEELPTPYETREQPDTFVLRSAPSDTKRIFIGHIGESDAAKYVASMLDEFGIPSAGSQIPEGNTGLLVPQEVSRAMRDSSAAILVFRGNYDARHSRDKMLGMLGAASVLFGSSVVMLHEGGARLSIGMDEVDHVDFDHERPGESALNLLVALHRAGIISVIVTEHSKP